MTNNEEKRKTALLHVHKIVDVEGGKFRVQSVGKKFICLQACAGTDVEEHKVVKELSHVKTVAQENFIERQRLLGLVFGLLKKFGEVRPDGKIVAQIDYKTATQLDPKTNLEVQPQPDLNQVEIRVIP